MKLVKSSLVKKDKKYLERIMETSTNIYYFCFGNTNLVQKYDRKMNLVSEGIDVSCELLDLYKEKKFSWISKKFEKTFAESK